MLGRRTQGLTHRPQSAEPPIMVKEPDVMREPLKALSLRPSLLSSASCRRSAEPPIMVKDPDVIREPLKALSLRWFWWCSDKLARRQQRCRRRVGAGLEAAAARIRRRLRMARHSSRLNGQKQFWGKSNFGENFLEDEVRLPRVTTHFAQRSYYRKVLSFADF